MTITYHQDLIQGTDEWLAARCGLITASEVKHLLTPKKLEPVTRRSVDERHKFAAHVYDLAAQRITKFVEPSYIGSDMLRGMDEEILAVHLYGEKYAEVEPMGFITNDKWGFTLGYSPDGLIHNRRRAIECKSRRHAFHLECVAHREVPAEFALQLQTGMMVAELECIDFISYSGGLPMLVLTVYPDQRVQDAIIESCQRAEDDIAAVMRGYKGAVSDLGLHPTERREVQEMFV